MSTTAIISQIFRSPIDVSMFFALMSEICEITDYLYVFDVNSFRIGIANGSIPTFIDYCRPFYYFAKQKYLTNALASYNGFTTVIRQICNRHGINFNTTTKWDRSEYTIVYNITHQHLQHIPIPMVSCQKPAPNSEHANN